MADKYFTKYNEKGNTDDFSSAPMVRYHGGKCCGVKEITGFCYSPSQKIMAYEPDLDSEEWWLGRDLDGEETATFTCLCTEKRPEETALERLEAVIAKTVKKQKGVLFKAHLVSHQKDNWHKELLKLGFSLDLDFVNSNSHNTIYCYSLLYQGGEVVATKEKG